MSRHQQNCHLRLSVLTGNLVRKEDFFKTIQVMEQHHYCMYFPSGLCRAKVLLLLNPLNFYSKTYWAVRAQGGRKRQRMSWLPKMFGTVQSSMGSSSAQAAELGCVCANEGKQKIIFSTMLNRLGGIKIQIGLNIHVLPKVKFHKSHKTEILTHHESLEFLYSSHHPPSPAHFSLSFTSLLKGTTSFQESWCFIWFWDPAGGMVHCSHSHQLFCIPRVKHFVSCFPDWRLGRKNTFKALISMLYLQHY